MRRAFLALCAICAVGVVAPAAAQAAAGPPPDVAVPMYPVPNMRVILPGFRIDGAQALAIAKTSGAMQAIHRAHHPLGYNVLFWVRSHYEVYFFFHGKVIADQLVSANGRLGPTFTGPLIEGVYARGAYGGIFDSPWVLAPLTFMFLLPLALLRRRSWFDVTDIAALLTFGISYALFDTRHLELGVWMAYPPLLYLLVRMLMRGRRPRSGVLDCRLPTAVLAGGLLLLVGARIALTLEPAQVMDVAIASALGAHRILHGQSLYYFSLGHPDTYGPIAYLAYVPFEAIWSGSWTYLPAARAATITFDLVTIVGLVAFGMRFRPGRDGRRLGLLLAWLWAACPLTVLGLVKNTNDGLIAMLVVLMMLALAGPVKRGLVVGLGAAAKFSPAILLPLMVIGPGERGWRSGRRVVLAFAVVVVTSIALFLPPGGIEEFYQHTIGYQLTRSDVFSIWALHPGLAPIKIAVEVGVLALAGAVAFRPRGPRTTAQVSALAAALLIAVQLPAIHWFYLYIVWFLPLVLIAVLGVERPPDSGPAVPEDISIAVRRRPEPELVGAG